MQRPSTFFLLRIAVSVILGTIIYILIPINPHPKIVNLIRNEYIIDNAIITMADIHSDGTDKMVKGFIINELYSIQVSSHKGGPKQYNITCDLGLVAPLYRLGDYDHDGKLEVVCVYNIGNKLYFDVIFPDDEESTNRYKKIFLDSLRSVPGDLNRFQTQDIKWADLNGDNYDEIIMSLFSTYETFYPRKIMAYDLKNDSLMSSIPLNNIVSNLTIFDHEGDGKPEITGSCGASDNNKPSHEDYPLHDQSSWLMVFNSELELRDTLPPEFEGFNTTIFILPKMIDGKTEIVGFCRHYSDHPEPDFLFRTKNLNEIIIRDTIPKPNGLPSFEWFPFMEDGETAYIGLRAAEYLVFINSDLKITGLKKLPSTSFIYKPMDLCDGEEPELITKKLGSSTFRIYDFEGKLLTEHTFNEANTSNGHIGSSNFIGQKTAYWTVGESIRYFTIDDNKWYYLRWLVLAGIIWMLYLFSWFSVLLQKKQLKKRLELVNRMRELELQGINSQLDPHFTFNALNVLTFLANSGNNEGVEEFVKHFSKMLRQQLKSSDKPSHKLSDELNLINHYIQLQKLRFEIPIEIDQSVESEVDQNLQIPKMLIHTHVENAIKHGLLPSKTGGTIKIYISVAKKQTLISIRDNGVGRNTDSKPDFESGHGKGMKILEQLIDLFYKLHKVRITQEFIDHQDAQGNATGTEVLIKVDFAR